MGKLGLVKNRGWLAVAAEEGVLGNEHRRRSIAMTAHSHGVDALCAAVLDEVFDEPPVAVPATEAGLEEMQRQLGGWTYVAVPPKARWAIVSTTDDVVVFLGPESILSELLGSDVPAAWLVFEEFAGDHRWTADQREYFSRMRAALDSYKDCPEAKVVELPTSL